MFYKIRFAPVPRNLLRDCNYRPLDVYCFRPFKSRLKRLYHQMVTMEHKKLASKQCLMEIAGSAWSATMALYAGTEERR